MGIDISYICRANLCFSKSQFNRLNSTLTFWMRRSHVVSIAGISVANYFSKNRCSTFFSMLQTFKNQHT